MSNRTINVATDFSKYPGGRFVNDGAFSGQRFRDDFLVPALKESDKVIVNLDGTLGYGSSFLEEAFGGLVRECDFDPANLKNKIELNSSNDTLKSTIQTYIADAGARARTR